MSDSQGEACQSTLEARPIGVTVLSLIAFVVSPGFLVLLGLFLHHIFVESIPPSFSDDTGAFDWFCFWLTVAAACFLMLGWITFTAGIDLWRLKNRGRKLAYISMIPFLPLGIGFFLSSDIWRRYWEQPFVHLGDFF